MGNNLFWGDIHGGHVNIPKFRECFASEEENWNTCKENHHKVATKRDIIYFLGDTVFSKERLADLATWTAAKKVLILGNHDTERLHIKDLVNVFDEIHGMLKFKDFWLTHCPIHPDELRGKMNIHGHIHKHNIDDNRYFNVCPEQTNYKPVSLDQIRSSEKYRKFYTEKLNAN